MDNPGEKNSALTGERVLDLTDDTGAYCSRLLADMGARVIRLERVGGDWLGQPSPEASNLGKRSVTLNLETGEGREIFRRLLKTADIVVESYPPGYLEALGLDYAELSKINPRLIMASITAFGQSGPYRDYQADELVMAALGGAMAACGEPELPPLKPFGNQSHYLAGLLAATAILLALWQRHTSGQGQHIDISRQECLAAALDHVLVRYFYQGVVAKRQGSLYWNNAFRIFPAHDGDILLSLFHQWATLVEWLDAEGMAEDLTEDKWRDEARRVAELDHVIEVLERWTRTHSVAEMVEKGQLMRFPWAAVTSLSELRDSPQLAARAFFVEVEMVPSGTRYKLPGAMAKLSRSPWKVAGRAPLPGEHNAEIYHDELGLSRTEIAALRTRGVI